MLSCEIKRPKQREFIGPGGCVGIVARNPGTSQCASRESLMKLTTEKNELSFKYISEQKKLGNRQRWEDNSCKNIAQQNINRKVLSALEQREVVTELRRCKLKDLLLKEEAQYREEIENSVETTQQRAEKIKQRAKELKEEKEKILQKIREEKMNQKFLLNNATVKAYVSKQRTLDIARDNKMLVEIKEKIKEKKAEEDKWFDCLWLLDAKKKEEKELLVAEQQLARKKENLAILQQQWAKRASQKMQEKELKLKEQQEMEKLMAEVSLEAKDLSENNSRQMHELMNNWQEAIEAKKKRLQEEKERDKFFGNFLLSDGSQKYLADNEKVYRKKQMLINEQKQFLQYRRELSLEEKQQDARMNVLLEEYENKFYAKKDEELEMRRKARENLRKDVENSWRIQIEQNAQNKVQALKNREEENRLVSANLHKAKLEQLEEHKRMRMALNDYKADLEEQVNHNEAIRNKLREEQRRLECAQQLEEKRFDAYMSKLIEDNKLDPKATIGRIRFNQGDLSVPHWTGTLQPMKKY